MIKDILADIFYQERLHGRPANLLHTAVITSITIWRKCGFSDDFINEAIRANNLGELQSTFPSYFKEPYVDLTYRYFENIRNKFGNTEIPHLIPELLQQQDYRRLIYYPKKEISDEAPDSNFFSKFVESSQNYFYKYYLAEPLPASITSLVTALQQLSKNDLCIEYGSGIGGYLVPTARECETAIGIELNREMVAVATLMAYWEQVDTTFFQKDVLDCSPNEFPSSSKAKIFINMPWGMKVRDILSKLVSNPITEPYYMNSRGAGSADWAFIIHALGIAPEGRIVALLAGNPLFNTSTIDLKIRRSLINRGVIEGVIALPDMLFTGTALAPTLLVLSPNNTSVKFYDATSFGKKVRTKRTLSKDDVQKIITDYTNSEACIIVSNERLEENDYILSPQRYVETQSHDSSTPTVALKEIMRSAIKRGCMLASSELEQYRSSTDTGLRYLMIQHISDYHTIGNMPYLKMNLDNKIEKALVTDGSILLSKQTPFKVGMASVKPDEKLLIAGNIYAIEIDTTRFNPLYVMLYLRSQNGLIQLNRFSNGNSVKTISIKDLENIIIPAIPREEQDKIVEQYKILADQLRKLDDERNATYKKIDSLL